MSGVSCNSYHVKNNLLATTDLLRKSGKIELFQNHYYPCCLFTLHYSSCLIIKFVCYCQSE